MSITLNEAKLVYTDQLNKMIELENGTRGFNAKAASDDKLLFNQKICVQHGLHHALDIIEDELRNRGLLNAKQAAVQPATTAASNTTNVQPQIQREAIILTKEDFTLEDAKAVLANQNINNLVHLAIKAGYAMRKLIIYLIFAVVLQLPELADTIKTRIQKVTAATLTKEEINQKLKKIIQQCISNQEIADTLKDIAVNVNSVTEKLEKHDTLNPKLFDANNMLKPEILAKTNEIVDEFMKILTEDDVKLNIKDIILAGSNASYNYTDKSDADIHIVADVENLNDPEQLYPKLYNAYRRLFEHKFDISFYGIPVEIYVETDGNPVVSGGIYSIKDNKWIKYPEPSYVPEVNQEAVDEAAKPWVERAEKIINKKDMANEDIETEIDEFFNDIYELRHQGIHGKDGGEFSIENAVFKEVRNAGLLDKLKELKTETIEQRLTLEEDINNIMLPEQDRRNYIIKISQLTHSQPIIQQNGLFNLYNIKEEDYQHILSKLRQQDYIESVTGTAGKYDFSKMPYRGMPARYYDITGRIKVK